MLVRCGSGRLAWLWGLLAVVLLPFGAARAGPFPLDPASGVADAHALSDVLRDLGGRWDVADILARQDLFRPSASVVPDLRVSAFAPGTLWFRLQPRSDAPGPWFLELAPEVDRAELILVGLDGREQRETLGMMVPGAGCGRRCRCPTTLPWARCTRSTWL